jgi:hypothetical protein
MVYGEIGRPPLTLTIKSRMVSYWANIVAGKSGKLNNVLYSILLQMHNNNIYSSSWLLEIKSILDRCGMSNIWITHSFPSKNWLKISLKQRLYDIGVQEWYSRVAEHSSCNTYKLFKTTFSCETYLTCVPDPLRKYLCKFRLRNCKLPIITCKYDNNDTMNCKLCNFYVGDEIHYLLHCPSLVSLRAKYIMPHVKHPQSLHNEIHQLLSSKDKKVLIDLGRFCKILITNYL